MEHLGILMVDISTVWLLHIPILAGVHIEPSVFLGEVLRSAEGVLQTKSQVFLIS